MDVLVAIDGSDNSMRALTFAAELADRFDGTLVAIHVSDGETAATETVFERARESVAEAAVDPTFELRATESLQVRTDEAVAEEVLGYAAEHDVDHIVIGHRDTGTIERIMIGSASEGVVRNSSIPVTVVP